MTTRWATRFRARTGKRNRRLRPAFIIERLESRVVMDASDGVGFEHGSTDPPGGGSVGQATITTANDYYDVVFSGSTDTLHVLSNDTLPVGDPVRITAVGPTQNGSRVTIDSDGYRLIFEAAHEISYTEKFTYTVTSDSGKQGMAEVIVHVQPRPVARTGPENDWFYVLEDSTNNVFHVLANDRTFADGVIDEIIDDENRANVRIAPDGKSLILDTRSGVLSEYFSYRVRRANGETATAKVRVHVSPRFTPVSDWYNIERDAAPRTLEVLLNDRRIDPSSSPQIISVTQPKFGGTVHISGDGQSVVYQPEAGFIGDDHMTYTVRYGLEDHHVATATIQLSVIDPLLAVDDTFYVTINSPGAVLNVLANDLSRPWRELGGGERGLSIAEFTTPSQGGRLVEQGGMLHYAPAAGFVGDETFSYIVMDHAGTRRQANVRVRVGPAVVDPFDHPRFRDDDDLAQYLLELAAFGNQDRFGRTEIGYTSQPWDPYVYGRAAHSIFTANAVGLDTADYSQTNTQIAGIDEADVVETDGQYIYALSGDELLIVDMRNLSQPRLVSAMKLSRPAAQMYLVGDQIVLVDEPAYQSISFNSLWSQGHAPRSSVLWIDVSDRTAPQLLQRLEVDGRIIDTRAIGTSVYLVIDSELTPPRAEARRVGDVTNPPGLPPGVICDCGPPPDPATAYRVRYESFDEYAARVRPGIIEASMPKIRHYNAAGDLLRTELLVTAEDIHKPSGREFKITTIAVLDLDAPPEDPLTSVGLIAANLDQIYMAPTGVYVLETPTERIENNERSFDTPILNFRVGDDSQIHLAATGKVAGRALNQFSMDEFEGNLRIATTEQVTENHPYSWRTVRTDNHLFVLSEQDGQLQTIGALSHLSPTQQIHAVRFLGDRAYVNTFRQVDPLLSIDLSDPANPRLRGLIEIPGFSNYLHPVGDDFLIGFGRDVAPATGALGAPQVSLFHIGDPDHPRLLDRLTMFGASQTSSEAFDDHHAVAYFAAQGVLSIPIHWQDDDGQTQSAAWTFRVAVDPATGDGSLEPAARIDHDSSVRRSLRIGDAVITVSGSTLKVNDIASFDLLASVNIAKSLVDDSFTLQEDASATTLNVLANDRLPEDARIASVDATGAQGVVEIAADGRSLIYTPAANFNGYWQVHYTVVDPVRGPVQATVSVVVENVPDPPQVADDQFDVPHDARQVPLDVLANDRELDGGYWIGPPHRIPDIGYNVETALIAAGDAMQVRAPFQMATLNDWQYFPSRATLTITAIDAISHGGTVEIIEDGRKLSYTPAAGFSGTETFQYTVLAPSGLSAAGIVTVRVAAPSGEGAPIDNTPPRDPGRLTVPRHRTTPRASQVRPATAGGLRATRNSATAESTQIDRPATVIGARRLTARAVDRARAQDAALAQM
jgi:uncharacterized secreted protein with C-terminal beta-propeller domain